MYLFQIKSKSVEFLILGTPVPCDVIFEIKIQEHVCVLEGVFSEIRQNGPA